MRDRLIQVFMHQYLMQAHHAQTKSKTGIIPAYSCLSYTWQCTLDDKIIQVNGRLFRVRRNLWIFLESVRQRLLRDGSHACPKPTYWSSRYESGRDQLSQSLQTYNLYL